MRKQRPYSSTGILVDCFLTSKLHKESSHHNLFDKMKQKLYHNITYHNLETYYGGKKQFINPKTKFACMFCLVNIMKLTARTRTWYTYEFLKQVQVCSDLLNLFCNCQHRK